MSKSKRIPTINDVAEAAGHGVDIDEKLAEKYPYKRACLPVNRLRDGTLTDW